LEYQDAPEDAVEVSGQGWRGDVLEEVEGAPFV
jgi:hypothetical protein